MPDEKHRHHDYDYQSINQSITRIGIMRVVGHCNTDGPRGFVLW